MSLQKKILEAARALLMEGIKSFSCEQLIVKSWQLYPDDFSLIGFPYPDSNKVIIHLCGQKGAVARGLLRKTAAKTYELNAKMVEEVAWQGVATLTPEQQNTLSRMLDQPAHWSRLQKGELSFSQALCFWGCPHDATSQVLGAIDRVWAELEYLLKAMEGRTLVLHDGMEVSQNEVNELRATHLYLLQRFKRQIALLVNRAERQAV